MKPTFHNLTVLKIIKETPDSVSITFQIPQELSQEFLYKPGQYVTLKKVINN